MSVEDRGLLSYLQQEFVSSALESNELQGKDGSRIVLKIAVHSTVGCDPAPCASCAGFIALLHADKAITLSFRGTNTLAQLVKETEQTLFHKKIPWIAGGYVSKYFHNAFNAVWNGGIKDKFEDLLKTYPAYAIWVTGHSLGGSMASLAASYIVANGYVNASKVKLVTFGQPRTGDSDYARALNEKVPYSFRIVHRRDIIPHFPLTCKNYSHHDSEVRPRHHAQQLKSLMKGFRQFFVNILSPWKLNGAVRDHTHEKLSEKFSDTYDREGG
ncbi:hypothetical protein Y032_0078g1191 [Ancylostoma ceylanicum]|uniref:Fungal lipase-type domain-containing protein n=1 Tax=Ancylostoma ceylanicum TaxID=53326 RepID=A0A016TTP2_9BILA|nr:hypothetical protein Y032_0078g1191 [Ancylostoma ceylanicum]